jgi:glucose/arabinose dehydrogenase
MRAGHPAVLAALALVLLTAVPARPARAALRPSQVTVSLNAVHTGFADPVSVTAAGDGSGRLFVVEQGGTVRLVSHGTVQATPYLDLRASVGTGGERGLLSIAFHPGFRTNGRLFAAYTDAQGDLRVVGLTTSPNATTVAASTELLILTI